MRYLISLGEICEVGFELRMHGSVNVAHFFDWLGTPAEGLIKVIAADFDVFQPDHLALTTTHQQHFVTDLPTGMRFRHQFPTYNGHVPPDFLLNYPQFIAKCRYLADRFRDYVRTKPVTFVRSHISQEQAIRLEAAFFKTYPGADAQFLYLVKDGPAISTDHGHSRPFSLAGSFGDPIAWADLLQSEGLIDAPFRHSASQIVSQTNDDYSLGDSDRFNEAQLLAAIAANPTHPDFTLDLVRYYTGRDMHHKAEEYALLALAQHPLNPDAIMAMTIIQMKTGQITQLDAANLFRQLGQLGQSNFKKSALCYKLAAQAYFYSDAFEQAFAYIGRAINDQPLDAESYYIKANSLFHLGRYQLAEYAIDTALKLSSNYVPYRALKDEISTTKLTDGFAAKQAAD